MTGCRDTAEDAVHAAFCRLLRRRKPPRDLKPYVFRSVRNAAVDQVRRRTQNREAAAEIGECSIFAKSRNPRDEAARSEFRARVEEGLARLSPDQRETIVAHLYGELTFREIAELREAPTVTVTAWYRRGVAKLREIVEEQ